MQGPFFLKNDDKKNIRKIVRIPLELKFFSIFFLSEVFENLRLSLIIWKKV